MADAAGTTVSVRVGATAIENAASSDCEFAASGTTITFAGYRQVYVESTDDTDANDEEKEALLPPLTVGQSVPVSALTPNGHATVPPARYTEASLVKKLEELGIGRPSTWASIIQTVQDRGYVWKKGQALVPTWTAFAVVGLMEKHFDGLVDYAFTARIEEDLDSIARNEQHKQDWLQHFYFGDDTVEQPGLKRLVAENLDHIDAAEINTFPIGLDPDGNEIVVKPGKYGPYVKRGDDTASVPDDLTPDELTVAVALQLLAAPKSDEPIGELDGYPVFAKNGRYAPTTCHPGWRSRRWPACSRRWCSSASRWRRPRSCCSCLACWAPTRPTVKRSRPTTVATGRTCRRARTSATSPTRSNCSPSRWPRQ